MGKKRKQKKNVTKLPRCHSHTLAHVLDFKCPDTGDVTGSLWAGSLSSTEEAIQRGHFEPSLVLDLHGFKAEYSVAWPIEANAEAMNTLPATLFEAPATADPAILAIDWDDGGIPSGLSEAWWRTLADAIADYGGDVVVNCQGGHGRTGTALAILVTMFDLVDGDPVAYVRDKYCDSAVETKRQIEYIAAITGRTVKEKPSDTLAHGGGAWWSENKYKYLAPPKAPAYDVTNGTGAGTGAAGAGTFYDPLSCTEGAAADHCPDDDDYDAVCEIMNANASGDLLTRGQ